MPRFPAQAPLDVTVLRSGAPDTVPGRTVNVCERGIAAVMAGELVPGEVVGVEVKLPSAEEPLRARAMVRYHDRLRCGMEFVGLLPEQRAVLRDWAKEPAEAGQEKKAEGKNASSSELIVREIAAGAEKKSATGGERGKRTADIGSTGRKGGGEPPEEQPARRGPGWILFLVAATVAIALFWWHWNRGWQELESGLKTDQAAATEKPQAQVPAEVMEKLIVHRVEPIYPPEARQAKLQGIIALDVVVGRDGSVISVRPLNGPDVLAQAAMDALRWWKFEPYRLNGQPAVVETTVAVEFKR
ncbi:MAG TPA: energy transducer TonB [Verrucomicrobiae bacterium]|nr:energy transducer TonB [Verrucomicrobiae bacterium]